jgi:hypothetical protein
MTSIKVLFIVGGVGKLNVETWERGKVAKVGTCESGKVGRLERVNVSDLHPFYFRIFMPLAV